MINIICTIVKITFWELIDQTNQTQLLYLAVNRANGFGIYLFVTHRKQVQRLLLSQLFFSYCLQGLTILPGLILRFISSSERDFQSVRLDPPDRWWMG